MGNKVKPFSREIYPVEIDESRDDLLSTLGRATVKDRYLLKGETPQGMFARVAGAYGDNPAHAQRLYDYMSQHWFMPATPILSNGGTTRGLPVSCFLNEVEDSIEGIANTYHESIFLASLGGGIGTNWSKVRSLGEKVGNVGSTSGIIPFVKVQDSLTIAISQGNLRRGSSAAYLHISHPEVNEFLKIRLPTGGDHNRKSQNIHHGVVISDAFMRAVANGGDWNLISPRDGSVQDTVSARELWITLLTSRIEKGEPYLLFEDTVNRAAPMFQREAGLKVSMSNLCSEITLPTGIDQYGKTRTAVCCLSSVNLSKWDNWKDNVQFIPDIMRFLDNVLQDFIDRAPDEMANAAYSAMRERSVGLGVMGFHTFLQSKGLPFGSVTAKSWNKRFFTHLRDEVDKASYQLAVERGPNPDAADKNVMARFSCKMAVAPTASISTIAGSVSQGIDPIVANGYLHKTLSGNVSIRNPTLERVLAKYGHNTDQVWSSIELSKGSVQHLPFLSPEEKEVFLTAFEIDQRWIIEHAADRSGAIDQSQSVNLFMPGDVSKKDLHKVHFLAWEKGVKSLYYLRSLAVQRAGLPGKESHDVSADNTPPRTADTSQDYEECLSCQ